MKKALVFGVMMMAMATSAFAGNGQVGSVGGAVALDDTAFIDCTIDTDSIFDKSNGTVGVHRGELKFYEQGEGEPTQTLPVNCSYQGNAFGCKSGDGKTLIYSNDISKTVHEVADSALETALGALLGVSNRHADVFKAYLKTPGFFGPKVTELTCTAN
ncbi:MAG: hypothetical protein J7501_12665 [Bdellovibrio sp.]|nr:hypothetical protein [Bdellovibrio sp.]